MKSSTQMSTQVHKPGFKGFIIVIFCLFTSKETKIKSTKLHLSYRFLMLHYISEVITNVGRSWVRVNQIRQRKKL